jgi:alanyl-tRNA synthetase
MVMQHAESPFETDVFTPIINEAKKILKINKTNRIKKINYLYKIL